MDVKKLIEDVISHLAENDSFSVVVPKLQVIAKLLKNEKLQSWIESEFIYGYKDTHGVPDYRKISVSNVKASFLHHQGFGKIMQYTNWDVPISNLGMEHFGEFMNLNVKQTVFAIERILDDNEGNIHLSLTAYEKLLVQQNILDNCEISNIHKVVSRTYFLDIITTAKAKLLDLFLELNESIFNNEINFNVMEKKEKISQIVNHTINTGVYVADGSTANIQNSNVVGGSQNEVHLSEEFKDQVLALAEKIEELSQDVETEREDIAFEISKIKLGLQRDESPKFIKSAFNAIKGIASSIAANEITEVINNSLQNINFQ
ncbi:hypothetical protein [uncultured Chryseobacterium sp.]|uniref:AbiTii domain-containing protein n=1 Tax=uncultured Chryseobacterium sp. TaxID=259322 RepID=UPI0026189C53|nr:hypothetical protein [uncultured Chryseobacterium sp.]